MTTEIPLDPFRHGTGYRGYEKSGLHRLSGLFAGVGVK